MCCFLGVDFLLWSCISPPSTSSSPWDPFPFISFQPLHTTALLVCMSTRSANREELIGPCSWPNSQWEQSVLGLSFQGRMNWGYQGCQGCNPYISERKGQTLPWFLPHFMAHKCHAPPNFSTMRLLIKKVLSSEETLISWIHYIIFPAKQDFSLSY